MKSTGIVRRVDELGRIVIPKELRKVMDIVENEDSLEVYTDGDKIVLGKYSPGCLICKSMKNLRYVKGKRICEECLEEGMNEA